MKETITYLLETKLHKNPNVDSEKLLRPLDNFNSRPFSKKCLSKHLTSLHFTLPSLVKKNRLVKRNNFTLKMVSNVQVYSLWLELIHFVKHQTKDIRFFTKDEVISMSKLVLDNIFVRFGWLIFQEISGIFMGTNCAPLLFDPFFYLYETEIMQDKTRQDNACFVLHCAILLCENDCHKF